jgi:hypothetical protein
MQLTFCACKKFIETLAWRKCYDLGSCIIPLQVSTSLLWPISYRTTL